MLLNLDDQQLRSSLALWKEAMAVGTPASQTRSTREHDQVLARLHDVVAGCLSVLHACTPADGESRAMRELVEELLVLRDWIQEGRTALNMMLDGQA